MIPDHFEHIAAPGVVFRASEARPRHAKATGVGLLVLIQRNPSQTVDHADNRAFGWLLFTIVFFDDLGGDFLNACSRLRLI